MWQTVRETESIIANTALCIASYADALQKIYAADDSVDTNMFYVWQMTKIGVGLLFVHLCVSDDQGWLDSGHMYVHAWRRQL